MIPAFKKPPNRSYLRKPIGPYKGARPGLHRNKGKNQKWPGARYPGEGNNPGAGQLY